MTENGRQVSKVVDLTAVHPAVMAPIAIASLAALIGLFVVLDSRIGDDRLTLAGQRTGVLLAARLSVIALAAASAAGVSLAIVATMSDVRQWGIYAAANALVAAVYALIGVLLGPLFGRVAGVFIAFLIPFLDIGIAQSPMLRPTPPDWAQYLPGYGTQRLLADGLLTPGFDEPGPLLITLGWLAALTLAAIVVFRGSSAVRRRAPRRAGRPRPAPAYKAAA